MKIVLLGAPGCGKGTQAAYMSKHYNLPHISTGDIFREIIHSNTPLGNKIKAIIDNGNLCPDELTIQIVSERLGRPDCKKGYLLDGFPRDISQAQALDKISSPEIVLNIDVALDKIEKRIIGRRTCPSCGGTFHIDFIGDRKECPTCGHELVTRKDDTVEVIEERLKVYSERTKPLIDYYKAQGKLKTVDGDKPIEEVFEEIKKVLG